RRLISRSSAGRKTSAGTPSPERVGCGGPLPFPERPRRPPPGTRHRPHGRTHPPSRGGRPLGARPARRLLPRRHAPHLAVPMRRGPPLLRTERIPEPRHRGVRTRPHRSAVLRDGPRGAAALGSGPATARIADPPHETPRRTTSHIDGVD